MATSGGSAARPISAKAARTFSCSATRAGSANTAINGAMATSRAACKPTTACNRFSAEGSCSCWISAVIRLPSSSLALTAAMTALASCLASGCNAGRSRMSRNTAEPIRSPRSANCCCSRFASRTFFKKPLARSARWKSKSIFAARTHSSGVVGLVSRIAATAGSSGGVLSASTLSMSVLVPSFGAACLSAFGAADGLSTFAAAGLSAFGGLGFRACATADWKETIAVKHKATVAMRTNRVRSFCDIELLTIT